MVGLSHQQKKELTLHYRMLTGQHDPRTYTPRRHATLSKIPQLVIPGKHPLSPSGFLPGCAAWGSTREEALEALQEGAQAYLEVLFEDGRPLAKGGRGNHTRG